MLGTIFRNSFVSNYSFDWHLNSFSVNITKNLWCLNISFVSTVDLTSKSIRWWLVRNGSAAPAADDDDGGDDEEDDDDEKEEDGDVSILA